MSFAQSEAVFVFVRSSESLVQMFNANKWMAHYKYSINTPHRRFLKSRWPFHHRSIPYSTSKDLSLALPARQLRDSRCQQNPEQVSVEHPGAVTGYRRLPKMSLHPGLKAARHWSWEPWSLPEVPGPSGRVLRTLSDLQVEAAEGRDDSNAAESWKMTRRFWK